uniref:Uncharacterized protein n=1 Tax=Arundo donax TaxID=35708 RepID=A0A0A8YIC9_ARUDO
MYKTLFVMLKGDCHHGFALLDKLVVSVAHNCFRGNSKKIM